MDKFINPNGTKHDQIIAYIEGLKIGSKISVRKIAKDLAVSEGTAYRAMKEARETGLIITKERIGTIRIERHPRNNLQELTFADVVSIVDGQVLGGLNGLDKTLNTFVIGAMKQEAMMQYIDKGSLLIVGNRDEAHHCALTQGAAVLITGGFGTSEAIKRFADELELPLISSQYDTFTVASMINRAMYDRLIKRKLILVEDIASIKSKVQALKANQTVDDWKQQFDKTGESRFPIVDEWNRVIGMITAKDVIGARSNQTLDKLMTRSPQTVQMNTSVTSAAHMMVWEGIELLPMVDTHRKLISVVRRDDVLQAMQSIQNQPQKGETFEDIIWSQFTENKDEFGQLIFRGVITPQMTSRMGSISEGVLTVLITQASYGVLKVHKKADFVLENISTYFLKPVQLESEIQILPKVIEVSRKFGKVEVSIFHQEQLVCKSMLTAQVIDPM